MTCQEYRTLSVRWTNEASRTELVACWRHARECRPCLEWTREEVAAEVALNPPTPEADALSKRRMQEALSAASYDPEL